jgi:hypothetical protein
MIGTNGAMSFCLSLASVKQFADGFKIGFSILHL